MLKRTGEFSFESVWLGELRLRRSSCRGQFEAFQLLEIILQTSSLHHFTRDVDLTKKLGETHLTEKCVLGKTRRVGEMEAF